MTYRFLIAIACVSLCSPAIVRAEEPVGKRPYEMVWVNRNADVRPALVDFENLDGWTATTVGAEASFRRSQQQPLWGDYVGALTYRGAGKQPVVLVKPPEPIAIAKPFNCVNLWVYGNNWFYAPDPKTPPVEIAVLLRGSKGQQVRLALGRVGWEEWWVMHRRLTQEESALLEPNATFEAIEVSGGLNTENRSLFFDNLAIYQEQLSPLTFDKHPARPFDPCPDGTPGVNVGPEKLPFPTRPETILPDNLTTGFQTALESSGSSFEFHYRGKDGHLVYRYTPATGTLGDWTAVWDGTGKAFQPLVDGGIRFAQEKGKPSLPPDKMTLVRCQKNGDTLDAVWQCTSGTRTAELKYSFALMQKSLAITIRCDGGLVSDVAIGKAVGLDNPRLVTLPFLPCDGEQRPAVVVSGDPSKPLFLTTFVDYYLSNASSLWATNGVSIASVTYNGGTHYLPKTDGRRNNCYERLFVTVSPRFEEVLPNVANPKSPWMHVTGERVWIAHGASNREQDYNQWKMAARYGMTNVLITDHETGWRDGGESFTFRTRTAPGRGGDPSQAEYARKLHALGFRYGIYNNYTDFAPVNEHWSEDLVTRLSDGQWQTAWARCYNPKPARAVEFEARLTPTIQDKFHLSTAYCDVHTAVTPWQYCDFDARGPRAGTFGTTFYSYGEIMLHQKKTWNGPVYSEGGNHWYYCGLTDGNYGQDQFARLNTNPWLVDFDLRKLHPLCCNFGMGNLEMFYGPGKGLGQTPEEREARFDRFLAATLAFGHTGFLVFDGGMPNAIRSYFSVQQVHASYAQEKAVAIRYADPQGRLLDTSAAVATDAFRRSQVITEYSNGLVVAVNGHESDTWKINGMTLPPNGWCVQDPKNRKLVAWSAMLNGHRADYVDSPAYTYANGRGRSTRFDRAACDGQLIAHKRDNGEIELIPVSPGDEFSISMNGQNASATALDIDGKELGPVETRFSRGLVTVKTIPAALSYRLRPTGLPTVSLQCERDRVVPGETVRITGRSAHAFTIPKDAKIGSRIWQKFDDAWLDFVVVSPMDVSVSADEKTRVSVTSHLPTPTEAKVQCGGDSRNVSLAPETPTILEFPLNNLRENEVRKLPITVTAGEFAFTRTWNLKGESKFVSLAVFPSRFEAGNCLRNGRERPMLGDETGAWLGWGMTTSGGIAKKALSGHPPYKTGVGFVYALFEPIDLPTTPATVRCEVGKTDGSALGDGILYRLAVVAPDGQETLVTEKLQKEHAWSPLEADLLRWAGKRVRLKLMVDVGPANNADGDWACWSEPRIESAVKKLIPVVTPE
jgi:hypothetical protein